MQLEASQDAFRESQQSLQESQAEKRNIQMQLEASQDAYRESQKSLQESQAEKKISNYNLSLHRLPTMNLSSLSKRH